MRWLPAEADGARGAPSSPGLPRGTKIDQDEAPQARDSAPRSTEPAQTDRSAGSHRPGSTASPGTLVLARTPHPSTAGLASALAHAFLAAESWSKPGLTSAGAITLGARRRWLGPLVTQILQAYQHPPGGAHRELARVITSTPAFTAAVERAAEKGVPIAVAKYAAGPATADGVALRAGIPAGVGTLAEILGLTTGELEWFADTGHWNRRARTGRLQHYRYVWRTRAGRVPRLLEVPGPRLKQVQRKVLHQLLASIPLHDAAHGFVPGRSALTGAGQHVGAGMVISLDLRAFFSHVGAGRVYGIFRQAGIPEAVAHAITGICTTTVPAAVLTRMPDGGSADERFALRQSLAAPHLPHLPQGSPSSPALANLSVRRLDSRLAGWADASNAVYTRYADDLTFSGPQLFARRADSFVRGVERIVGSEGHSLNPQKTRVKGAAVRQVVTGVVVNSTPNVPRPAFDELKAILHNCVVNGPESQNAARGSAHRDFRAHLLGRVSWVEYLLPARGRRLREEFNRIQW